MISFQLNGKSQNVNVPDDTPLLWVLRDTLGLTGTKFGCGMALCGACTVHIDGAPGRACVTPISTVAGRRVSTIESMTDDQIGRVVEQAWVRHDVAQCGYCQSGQVMSAVALLKTKRRPSDEEITSAMSGNLCRCGSYARIHAAVKDAAQSLG